MNRILTLALLLSIAIVSGCATHNPVELRPYTAEETHQLALEDLNRRGLSFDEYQAQKARLMAQPQMQAVHEFDNRSEVSVDTGVITANHQG